MSVNSTDLDTVHKLNERLKNYSNILKRGALITDIDLSIRKDDTGTERESNKSLKYANSVFEYENRGEDSEAFLKEANEHFREFVARRIVTTLGELTEMGVRFQLEDAKKFFETDADVDDSLYETWKDEVAEAIYVD